jgi:hypothetical protein
MNGKKSNVKKVYMFFVLMGLLWYYINIPSTWHDRLIFDCIMSFINLLFEKFWVLNDLAFF